MEVANENYEIILNAGLSLTMVQVSCEVPTGSFCIGGKCDREEPLGVLVMINVSSGSNVLRNVKYAKEFALLIVVNLYVKNHHHQMFRAISRWSMYLIRANAEYSHFIVKWYSMFTTCLIVLLKGILLVPSLHIFHKTSVS